MLNTPEKTDDSNSLLIALAFIFATALLVTMPVFFYGIPNGNDFPQHYQFAITFLDSIKEGIYYPGWSAHTNYGYGDVGVRFYPPFAYYLLIFFKGILGNWYDATCATVLAAFFASGTGVFLWAKEYFSERASLASALVYILIPYHINQLYKSFLFAEFIASAILPFCFLYAARVCSRNKKTDVIGLAVSFGLLIATHIPMALIGSICLFVYCCFSLEKSFLPKVARLSVSVLIGIAASAFYWIRMIPELSYVAHNTSRFTTSEYDYRQHFALSQFFGFLGIESSTHSSYLDLLLLITLAVFVPSLLFYYLGRTKLPKLNNNLAVLLLSLFMLCPLSLPIWQNVETIQKIQFPWRWMALLSLSAVIFVAAGFEAIFKNLKSPSRHLSILAIGLIVIGIVYTVLYPMNQIFFYPKDYLAQVTERLRTSKSNECWLPVWANQEALTPPNIVTAGDRKVEVITTSATDKTLRFQPGNDLDVRVNTFYYPHWKAYLDGAEIPLTAGVDGAINFSLPTQNAAEIRLSFVEPFYINWASILSMLVWLIMISFLAFNKLLSFKKIEGLLVLKT